MKEFYSKAVLVVFTLCSSYVRAYDGYSAPVYETHVHKTENNYYNNNNLKVDGLIFESDFKGVEEYMTHLKKTNPSKYKDIYPDYFRIFYKGEESREDPKWVAYVGSVGIVAAITGLLWLGTNEALVDNPTSNRQAITTMAIGTGISLFAIAFSDEHSPSGSRKEILEFINIHNKINKKTPIEFRMGLIPSIQGIHVATSLVF